MSVDELASMFDAGGGVSFDTGIVETVTDARHLLVDIGERSVPVSVPANLVGAAAAGAVVRLSRLGDAYTLDSVLSAPSATLVPVGAIMIWWTGTPPVGWLFCDGATFSAATYPQLAALLGTNILPNLAGYFLVGFKAGDPDFGTLWQTGGAKTVALSVDEMPSHAHTESWASIDGSRYTGSADTGGWYSGDDVDTGTDVTEYTGGGEPHENLPPYKVCRYIIRGV